MNDILNQIPLEAGLESPYNYFVLLILVVFVVVSFGTISIAVSRQGKAGLKLLDAQDERHAKLIEAQNKRHSESFNTLVEAIKDNTSATRDSAKSDGTWKENLVAQMTIISHHQAQVAQILTELNSRMNTIETATTDNYRDQIRRDEARDKSHKDEIRELKKMVEQLAKTNNELVNEMRASNENNRAQFDTNIARSQDFFNKSTERIIQEIVRVLGKEQSHGNS